MQLATIFNSKPHDSEGRQKKKQKSYKEQWEEIIQDWLLNSEWTKKRLPAAWMKKIFYTFFN